MKQLCQRAAVVVLAHLAGGAGAVVISVAKRSSVSGAVRLSDIRSVAPQDVAGCVKFMNGVLDRPEAWPRAVERAIDHCAVSKKEDDRNYVCLNFKAALENAFYRHDPQEALSSEAFCKVSEGYMLALRGASRIASVGHGPLVDFHLSPKCEPAVASHFQGKGSVSGDEVADLWYGMCMNQDCGHYLPSRTRWCATQERPTHSVEVCEALRKYAADATPSSRSMDPKQVCHVYSNFVSEMGSDVEAYEHVVHADSRRHVPKLHDKARALQSSKMLNDADHHDLRDGSGDAIVRNGAAKAVTVGSPAVLAALLLAAATLAA